MWHPLSFPIHLSHAGEGVLLCRHRIRRGHRRGRGRYRARPARHDDRRSKKNRAVSPHASWRAVCKGHPGDAWSIVEACIIQTRIPATTDNGFWSTHSPAAAKTKIRVWIKRVTRSGLRCFDKFINTLGRLWQEIINYLANRESSGFVAGLNNKLKVLKRRCYGLFNLKHLFQRIFLDLVGHRLFAGWPPYVAESQ